MGKSNPENKGLSDEEIARKNAEQPKQGQCRGRRDGSGRGQGDRRKFNQVSPKKGKRGPNRKHIPNGDDDDTTWPGKRQRTRKGKRKTTAINKPIESFMPKLF
ncbi:MAG: hypothetical protein ACP5DZ_07265 [Bacteroidales bacterium]